MKKSGLGRGLGALMGELETSDTPVASDLNVDISLIDTDPNQPRKNFNTEKLAELANSITVHGIMQPLLVIKNGGRYTIVAGERRFRAAKMAGLSKVPVIIKELSEKEVLELSIIENIQREDLNAIEQANALIELMEKYNLTQEKAAERIGKSRSAIANLTRLASLPSSVKKMVEQGQISAGHARALLPLETPKLICEIAQVIVKNEMSVRQTEDYVRKILNPPLPKEKAHLPDGFSEAMNNLSEKLETKVSISGSEKKGKIVIEYYSKDQLFGIYDILNRD